MAKYTKLSVTWWYTSEIQRIMHGFGDCSRPLEESANLIEEIVHSQMVHLIQEANNVACSRGCNLIGLEDILFLMRKDKVKLARLIRYLSIKDVKDQTKISQFDEENSLPDSTPSNFQSLQPKQKQTKRVKQCYDFLSSIDQTGELLTVFKEDFHDEVRLQRNLRMDQMTMNMTKAQYLRYSEARQANFTNKAKPGKFRDWLLKNDTQSIKINAYALEVLQYLAYETVAEIVDIALLVKQDGEREEDDPVSGFISRKKQNQDYPLFNVYIQSNHTNSSSNNDEKSDPEDNRQNQNSKRMMKNEVRPSLEVSPRDCITPNDIREAIRRYHQPKGPLTLMNKCYIRPTKSICL